MPVHKLIGGRRRSLAAALLSAICLIAATHLLLPVLAPLPHPFKQISDADVVSEQSLLPDYAQPDALHSARLGRRYLLNDQPSPWGHPVMDMSCSMHTCFNFSRCRHGFTVYVYPRRGGGGDSSGDDEVGYEGSVGGSSSDTYDKILRAIRLSPYYTDDPEKACIFVPGVDTLDRDSLSPRFKADASAEITGYSHWRGRGENHLIFNLYAGTWPNYYEHELGIPTDRAILAKASFSTTNIRSLFDVSFPLVHSQHPLSAPPQAVPSTEPYLAKARRPILLSFKGKRYVIGSGSASRNSLYHLDNGRDILLFTTCRHGDNWRRFSDSRCALDNARYGMWDYDSLLHNSTFCLVPRGRRLGSYRFLEVLQAGCIPVVLSNDWELPFSEVIDWRRAVVWADERQLLQLPDIVRSIPDWRIIQMRQQCRFLYSAYFSSVQAIVRVTLELLADRIGYLRRPGLFWNSRPGGLLVRPTFSLNPCYYPFYGPRPGPCPPGRMEHVTAAVFCGHGCHQDALFRVLHSLSSSNGLFRQVFVIWRPSLSSNDSLLASTPPPLATIRRLVGNGIRVSLSAGLGDALGGSLSLIEMPDWSLISQDAVLLINASAFARSATKQSQQQQRRRRELRQMQQLYRLAFSVWRAQPDRAVGLQGALHYYDDFQERWSLTTAPASDVSCPLGPVLMLHRYYVYLMASPFAHRLRRVASVFDGCDLLAWSFLVSHVTGRPPAQLLEHRAVWAQPEFLSSRQLCLQPLANALSSAMPLTASRARIDPLLYGMSQSAHRKLFPDLESA